MATFDTTREGQPQLTHHDPFNTDRAGRNYGLVLAALTAVYLSLMNLIFPEVPIGIRFAKYLIIVAVVWVAVKSYADASSEEDIWKGEFTFILKIAMWAIGGLATLNVILSSINPQLGFEQFMNDGETFGDMMVNSFFVAMETFVMVVMAGFIFMQYYKRGSDPEDA